MSKKKNKNDALTIVVFVIIGVLLFGYLGYRVYNDFFNKPDVKKEITDVMGMYDVLPTIANMFGFEEKYSLGHDIFSSNEKIVIFPNGNVLTNNIYYSNSNDEYITFNDNPIDADYIEKLKEYSSKILDISNGIVYYDLIDREEKLIGECEHE